MDVHKPKPIDTWRDFAKELGVIVLGIVIALGLEQLVDVIHHRMQAHEMAEKLQQESRENRATIRYDLEQCAAARAAIGSDLATVTQWLKTPRPGVLPLSQVPYSKFYRPADAAWTSVRDGSLLPIMPKRLVDNGWKIDTIDVRLDELRENSERVRSSVRSLIATTPLRPMTNDFAYELLGRLNEYQEEEGRLCFVAVAYSGAIDTALAGRALTIKTDEAAHAMSAGSDH
ncbi:MAG TPA: hypothetical protein VGL66_07515 [Caulobacteraceae bacterium]|jgi:hypothetical protein